MSRRRHSALLVLAASVIALALVGLVAWDYQATSAELVGLLREQARAHGATIAAAARSNRAAASVAASQLGERLLQQARALAALDRERRLTPAALQALGERDPLLSVVVIARDGTREASTHPASDASEPVGGGRGPRAGRPRGAGASSGRGWGGGRGPGGGALHQILDEGKDEVVTGAHTSRWGQERVAAGVRRPGGGAIVVTVDASAIQALEAPASLEALLADITRGSPEIAYTTLAHAGEQLAFGDEAPAPPAAPGERALSVAGRPVLEFASEVSLGEGETARLRLGLRLDGVRRVEERMALRLLASVAAAGSLVALAIGLAGLRRRFGALSERHARAEEALRRRDRLAAMGELAATVAHEVRNPLNTASMTAQRLRREFLHGVPAAGPERAELEELLGVMSNETQRIDRIVRQFLEYARPRPLAPEPAELGELVEDVAARARPLAEARGIRLDVEAGGASRAHVDPAQLRQALDNLVRNAIEATPEGGRVSIGARRDGAGQLIEVRDTGHGIAPDRLPRIFDLYFTTKPEGTGVGLAVTQQIVSAHGGTIEVDSRPGAGTNMAVRLPAGKDAARG